MTPRIEKSVDMQDYEQSVFISYAWGGESENIVNQIDEALQQRGLKIIRDKRDLGYKGSISAFMERIGQGNCVIVVISDKYLRSPNCMFELVEIAEGKQFYDRVFPIVLSNAEIYDPVKRLQYVKHWEDKLTELDQAMRGVGQANLQGIREEIDQYSRIRDKVSGLTSILKDMNTLTSEMHKDSDFSEIYAGIEQRMAGSSGQVNPKSGESPYMGLRYFDTSNADLFYGRDSLTNELLARVQGEPFLAIVGASGSGKSSVARAGLIPAWKTENEIGAVHVITPTARPLESLATSLTRDSESVTATSTLMDDMQKDSRSLRLYVRKLTSTAGNSNLLLVVDQFEETFTLCKDLTERKAFIENLLSLVEEGNSAARVVITLRADFYHHCFEYEGLRLTLEKHQANIGAMTQEELRQAISAPAEKNGWDFQPGLVDLILQDVGTEPGALPLLSHALLETWKRRQGHTLTLQGYHEAGGVKKAIAQTAESVYDHLSSPEKEIARNIFLRLTELGEGVQDTRRRVRMEELAQMEKQDAVAKVLNTLTEARLITTELDSAEVAHEALIREWGTLRKWLDEDRDSLRLHRHLTESAQEWERRGRDSGELYRGVRLVHALEWAKANASHMSMLETEFLRAGENSRAREYLATRIRWASILGTIIFGLVLSFLGVTGKFDRFFYRPLSMEWVTVPAGEFIMGSNGDELHPHENEQPVHTVDLDAFEIGTYAVTNKQYYQCVKAGVCSPPFNEIYDVTDYQDFAVTDLKWSFAVEFCQWNDPKGRLPTEAEWEKAARGTDGRAYPWGDEFDPSYVTYNEAPVGSREKGKSPYGAYDMVGSVFEWVADWYVDDYYSTYPPDQWPPNPTGPTVESDDHVLRGGTINYNGVDESRVTYREPGFVDWTEGGVRCARDIP